MKAMESSQLDCASIQQSESNIYETNLKKDIKTDKENTDVPIERQPILMNISVNSSANYLNRLETNGQTAKAFQKPRTDSFARHKAHKLEVTFSDFYKSKKEFKLISDEERKFLIEDLYETDKCYYFNVSKVEIHKHSTERELTSRQKINGNLQHFWSEA